VGVAIYGGATSNRIGTNGDGVNDAAERNLVSGNKDRGVIIADPGSTQNVVAGNYIGTDITGTVAVANASGGIDLFNGAHANRIGVSDRDAAPADDRNLVSGNGNVGLLIQNSGTNANVVAGNYIGTDVTGTKALGNGGVGVFIETGAQSNRVGTNGDGVNDAAERNVICANAYQGVALVGSGTNQNVVAGNYIGVDATGAAALGNGNNGIWVLQGASGNRIGTNGTDAGAAGEGNRIGGNAFSGVLITDAGSNNNLVAGNAIGTDPTGTKNLGNGENGVGVGNGAQNNQVGGSAGLANVIAFNRLIGVAVTDPGSTGNAIRVNSIFGNGQQGIDLGTDGVTLNHGSGAATGPNNFQNYPLITAASPGTTTTVSGTLNGTATRPSPSISTPAPPPTSASTETASATSVRPASARTVRARPASRSPCRPRPQPANG
jgi:titin